MSNLIKHAETEFQILMDGLRASGEDASGIEMQEHMHSNVMDLLKVLDTQGHSGGSIGYLVHMFSNAAFMRPLSPITGADSEWVEVGNDVFQNKRHSSLFKEGKDGRAYDIDGYVKVWPDGCRTTGGLPRFYVDFPYTPTRAKEFPCDENGNLTVDDHIMTGDGVSPNE